MTGKDLFEALLKLLGVVLLVFALRAVAGAVYIALLVGYSADVVGTYLLPATIYTLTGLCLLTKWKPIADSLYRNRD